MRLIGWCVWVRGVPMLATRQMGYGGARVCDRLPTQAPTPITIPLRSIKGADRFSPELVLALLVSGAGAWAAAAFTAFSAWLAIGLGLALAGALWYLDTQGKQSKQASKLARRRLFHASSYQTNKPKTSPQQTHNPLQGSYPRRSPRSPPRPWLSRAC